MKGHRMFQRLIAIRSLRGGRCAESGHDHYEPAVPGAVLRHRGGHALQLPSGLQALSRQVLAELSD